jgi:hypothetical protein
VTFFGFEEVGGSIPSCEISSLLDGKFARWSTASCVLALACQPFVSKEEEEEEEEEIIRFSFIKLGYIVYIPMK